MSRLENLLDKIADESTATSVTVAFCDGYRIKVDRDYVRSFTGACLLTSGLNDFKHLDFEIVLPTRLIVAAKILKMFADRVVKQGHSFSDGYTVFDSSNKAHYQLSLVPEVNRLRVVLPDENYRIGRNMDRFYAMQYDFEWPL